MISATVWCSTGGRFALPGGLIAGIVHCAWGATMVARQETQRNDGYVSPSRKDGDTFFCVPSYNGEKTLREDDSMDQKERNDLGKMLGNKQVLSQLAGSPDAQALAAMLTQGRDRAQLEQMAQSAVSGDTQSLKSLMQTITENPEGMELLRRLSESFHKK